MLKLERFYLLQLILEVNVSRDHVQLVEVRKTLIFPIKGTIETISRVALPWATKGRKRAGLPPASESWRGPY